MEQRAERITVETDRYRITGDVALPREGYRSRMSDFLSAMENGFLALTDARIVPLDGGPDSHREFVAVAVRHVTLAHPAER